MSAPGNPAIYKAYDIRGVYGEDIDAPVAHDIGRAFTRVIAGMADKAPGELTLGLGRDMRLQAPELAAAYRDGMVAEGAAVLDAGQVGTEMLYFLVGSRELDGGLMCTASHNPKRYTGVKLVRRGALALSGDEGIGEIRDLIADGLGDEASQPGSVSEVDVYEQFAADVVGLVDGGVSGSAHVPEAYKGVLSTL
jgi:phosphomannomutase